VTGRILLGALVLVAAAGAAWAAFPFVAVVALLQLRPGLLPGRGRLRENAFAALALTSAVFGGLPVALLLPVALRSLRRERASRSLRTCRDALLLSMVFLVVDGTGPAVAGAIGTTLLLAVLLPRLHGARGVPAWGVPAVAALAALLFVAMPRFEPRDGDGAAPARSGRFGKAVLPGGNGTGGATAATMPRRVSIGEIGRLQRDFRPLIEVTVFRDGRPADAEDLGPLFRSGALEEFDGTTWESRGGTSRPLRGPGPDGFLALPRRRLPRGEAVEQHLRFLQGGSDALFSLGMPTAVGGEASRAGVLLVPRGEIRMEGTLADGALIAVRSVAAPGDYAPVDGEDLSDARFARLVAVPPGHERAAALARGELGVSTGLTGPALLARVETFLKRRCRYSLDIAPAGGATPVEAFLFDARRGHCELFAAAAAVMLRSLGVPTRVVIGFRGGLFDRGAMRYTLRGADAHAWTEAWFEETGWVTFDPTPSADPLRPEAPEEAAVPGEAAADGPGFLERILGFDGAARRRVLGSVAAFARNAITAADGSPRWPLPALLAALAVLLALRGRTAAAVVPRPAAAPPPVPLPEAWTVLLARLAALGIHRGPAETGLELAARARAAGVSPPESLDRLAAAYALERFGAETPTPAVRAELSAAAGCVTMEARAGS
jgi:transglutaminase-like putative cysteine protease